MPVFKQTATLHPALIQHELLHETGLPSVVGVFRVFIMSIDRSIDRSIGRSIGRSVDQSIDRHFLATFLQFSATFLHLSSLFGGGKLRPHPDGPSAKNGMRIRGLVAELCGA